MLIKRTFIWKYRKNGNVKLQFKIMY